MAGEQRLIDANTVADGIIAQLENEWGYDGIREDVRRVFDSTPTVDAVEVVHGRWIKDGDAIVCSSCGEEHGWDEYRATYCEDCGAKMDGGNDDVNQTDSI